MYVKAKYKVLTGYLLKVLGITVLKFNICKSILKLHLNFTPLLALDKTVHNLKKKFPAFLKIILQSEVGDIFWPSENILTLTHHSCEIQPNFTR